MQNINDNVNNSFLLHIVQSDAKICMGDWENSVAKIIMKVTQPYRVMQKINENIPVFFSASYTG